MASYVEKKENKEVKKWIAEINYAKKEYKTYKKSCSEIYNIYRSKESKYNYQDDKTKSSFSILYANTETLSSAIFNSLPKPDVKRRFDDKDPISKVASQIIERALEFFIEDESFSDNLKKSMLEFLLLGRGICRVKYLPSFAELESTGNNYLADDLKNAEYEENESIGYAGESLSNEVVAWQQVVIENISYENFLCSHANVWQQVSWIAFKHCLRKDELIKRFGDIGENVPLNGADIDDIESSRDYLQHVKTAEVWEIWDKNTRKVYFLCEAYQEDFLLVNDDPLNLIDFFPIPLPAIAIDDSCSLEPIPLYVQYRTQAKELNKITERIDKIIDALRIRGVYDSAMGELERLMQSADNELVPTENVMAWVEKGGIDKAIWLMPIDVASAVLQNLFAQREACKQIIYEISGISDILRGATNPNETLGAQQIKARSGSQRVAKLSRCFETFVRDALRLMAEIICDKIDPQILMQMTGINLPSENDLQLAQIQGQQIPPDVVTMEQVFSLLKQDVQRTFKIDVQTDSMIAESIQSDATELNQLVQSITNIFQGLSPAIMAGALPIDAAKDIVLSIARRARMGSVIEEAIDKLQMPTQQNNQKNTQDSKELNPELEMKKEEMRWNFENEKLNKQLVFDYKKLEKELEMQKYKIDVENMTAMQLNEKKLIQDKLPQNN